MRGFATGVGAEAGLGAAALTQLSFSSQMRSFGDAEIA